MELVERELHWEDFSPSIYEPEEFKHLTKRKIKRQIFLHFCNYKPGGRGG